MRYAKNTSVSADRSRAEIERVLEKYGAEQFAYGWENAKAMLGFKMKGKLIRFILPMPSIEEASTTPKGRKRRGQLAKARALEQERRRRWRAMALIVKAKLEAVSTGIVEFEQEFMAHIVLPNGRTAGEWALPQIEKAYQKGEIPKLLPITTGK